MTAALAGKIIAILYLITLIVIGFWSSRRIKSREDYFVASRQLSPILMGIAFFTAVCGVWSYIGAGGVAYGYGIPEWISFITWISAVAWVAFLLLPAIVSRASKYKSTSFTGCIRDMHGGGYSLTAITSVVVVCGYIMGFVGSLKGVGVTLAPILGIDANTALLIGGIVIVLYAIMGGLRAVVWTDVAGLVFMVIAFFAVIWMIQGQGGIAELTNRINAFNPKLFAPDSGSPYGSTILRLWVLFPILYIFYQCLPHQWHYYMSVGLGKRAKSGAALFTLLAICSVCMIPYLIFLAMGGHVMLPGVLADADSVMPMLFQTYAPAAIYVLFTIGVFTAIITTIDGGLLTVAACIDEMLVPLYNKYGLGTTKSVRWGRVVMVIIWAFAMFWAWRSPPAFLVQYLVIGWFGMSAIFAAPTVFALWKPGTKWGAFTSILVGLIVMVVLVVTGKIGPWGIGWLEQPLIAMCFCVPTYYIASAIDRKVRPIPAT